MILGIGADLCDVERIKEALEHRRVAFLRRLFTELELCEAARQRADETAFAIRFAVKEAAAKALGTGITRWVGWHDFSVTMESPTRPTLLLSGGAQRKLQRLTPPGQIPIVHLTANVHGIYASAFVLLEARCNH
jgi:holo-[acyl-carrier protein] synthase